MSHRLSSHTLSRLYGALLHAYPRPFREEYGVAMHQLFRDRLRERPPLARFLARTAADWFVTVIQERSDMMRTLSVPAVRALMLIAIALDLLLLWFRFAARHDVFHGDAETSFAVLLMYGLIVVWATANPTAGLLQGTRIGLVSGAVLFVATTYAYFIRVPEAAGPAVGVTCMIAVFGLWIYAGYRAGALAGSWSAAVCVLLKVTLAYLVLLTPGPDPQVVAAMRSFQRGSGPSLGVHPWLVQQVLLAGGLHLLIAPVFGAILGGLGSLATRFKRSPVLAPQS